MKTPHLTVLFDGGCPLCNREISYYQTLTALEPIEWVDIDHNDTLLQQFNVQHEAAMAEFHVFDTAGHLHKGADGFIALWLVLPYFRWLAQLCKTLHLLPLLRWGYGHFAQRRLRHRCTTGVCGS